MSGGGKRQTQTQNSNSTQNVHNVNTSAAPTWAQPHLEAITQQARTAFDNASGFTGGFSDPSRRGFDIATRTALGGNPLGMSAYDSAVRTIQNGGLTGGQRDVLGNMRTEYQNLQAPTASETNLRGYAEGRMLTGNPYLDKMLETTNAGIANRTNGMFGAAGRSFSPAHAAAVARNIAASDNQARYADYDRQVQNQFEANRTIDNAAGARAAQRYGLLGQTFSGEQQGMSNVFNFGTNAGTFDANRYLDANTLRNIGQQYEANDAMRANLPWQNLQNYLATVRGASNGYGTTTQDGTTTSQGTQTTTSPGPSALQQIVGLGMAGTGLASGFGGLGGGGKGGKGGGAPTSAGGDILRTFGYSTGGGYGGGGIGSR